TLGSGEISGAGASHYVGITVAVDGNSIARIERERADRLSGAAEIEGIDRRRAVRRQLGKVRGLAFLDRAGGEPVAMAADDRKVQRRSKAGHVGAATAVDSDTLSKADGRAAKISGIDGAPVRIQLQHETRAVARAAGLKGMKHFRKIL